MNENIYLGDGLYVSFDGYRIKLYASNGMIVTDEVFLEPDVLSYFLLYVKEIQNDVDKPPIV
jgi:hypothetical protein